jgi:hypothetical protein
MKKNPVRIVEPPRRCVTKMNCLMAFHYAMNVVRPASSEVYAAGVVSRRNGSLNINIKAKLDSDLGSA